VSLRALGAGLLLSMAFGCAALPTLGERPEAYHLYRATRVAPTQEERLRAADRYLREVRAGVHRREVRAWFTPAEERYYLDSFERLPKLYAYLGALPNGPHNAEVRARIAYFEHRRERRRAGLSQQDERIARTQGQLIAADASRRAFVGALKAWTLRLAKLKTFGEPTSELDDETIFAFRLSPPRGSCQADTCRKLLELQYQVPGEGDLVLRDAVLEVQLLLDRGLLVGARLAGPELWTRLAEALSLQALPTPTADERVDALNRSALIVRSVLEPLLPAATCGVEPQPPVVLERRCHGLRLRMLAGQNAAEDDVLEVLAAPDTAAPSAPASARPATSAPRSP
jgi:hypothetical protein